jgi:hypothetical protein
MPALVCRTTLCRVQVAHFLGMDEAVRNGLKVAHDVLARFSWHDPATCPNLWAQIKPLRAVRRYVLTVCHSFNDCFSFHCIGTLCVAHR